MKRRTLITLFLFVISAFLFSTCEVDPYCKDCWIVTYDADGNEESRLYVGEFCGEELDEVDGVEDTDPQGITTVYECE
ncbi:MAG: hypothetical protein ACOCWC_02045 [Bacteroidota bacterium]